MKIKSVFETAIWLLLLFTPVFSLAQTKDSASASNFIYINTAFENASQLDWNVDSEGVVQVALNYDHERSSINRANGHWHFLVQAKPGSDLTIEMRNFDNYWNGKMASPVSAKTNCFVSEDGVHWRINKAEFTPDRHLKTNLHFNTGQLYVASVEPYRISDLEKFKNKIKNDPRVNISIVGKTVEGRPLEIIRVGNPNAKHAVFLRARAHSWEPGGNWIVQGLVNTILKKDSSKYLNSYCVYIMPMTNKDGVAHGRTRFNVNGVDLNRQWDKPADSILAPEKYAFEQWLKKMIASGKKLDLAIDLHNDEGGNLHVNLPTSKNGQYTANLKRFEQLLYKYTWFTEGPVNLENMGSFGEGMADRFGIDACIFEFNYEWAKGLNKVPMGKDWELMGSELKQVFYDYFQGK